MTYENIVPAAFVSRPNRFIANIKIDGKPVACHVKNTGRCKELLTPEARLLVQTSDVPNRKTSCDLIAVRKGDRLVNMDAQAPNKVFGEWLSSGGMGFTPTLIRPECTHGDSRFDFYFEAEGRKAFAEIKGVTLEENGVVRFPDAPTKRGVKHLYGLIRAAAQQKARDILKSPDKEDILSETYDEMMDELSSRIAGLTHQLELTADRRNTVIRVNRIARTALEVFDEVFTKDKLDKSDLELILDKIVVYEDHIDILLKNDIDTLLRCGGLPETEDGANFPRDTMDISHSAKKNNRSGKARHNGMGQQPKPPR